VSDSGSHSDVAPTGGFIGSVGGSDVAPLGSLVAVIGAGDMALLDGFVGGVEGWWPKCGHSLGVLDSGSGGCACWMVMVVRREMGWS